MLRFTFGERKICSTIKESQNIMNMIVGFFLWLTFLQVKRPFCYRSNFKRLMPLSSPFSLLWWNNWGPYLKRSAVKNERIWSVLLNRPKSENESSIWSCLSQTKMSAHLLHLCLFFCKPWQIFIIRTFSDIYAWFMGGRKRAAIRI